MKIRTLILFLLCALLLVACSKGDAAATQPTAAPAATEVALVHETPAPTAAPQEARQVVIAAAPAEVTQAPVTAPVVTATPARTVR